MRVTGATRLRRFLPIAAASGLLTVALGAFGAHALSNVLASSASVWQTAVHYQMFHTLALFAMGLLPPDRSQSVVAAAGWLFLAGMVLFCGSLYLLALTGSVWLGMITPIGGVLFLLGWGALAVALARNR